MFRQLFSTGGGTLTVLRLGFSQIKPSIFVPAYSSSRLLLSELCLRRQFYSLLSINSELCCPLYRTVGQRIFCRGYSKDTRRKRSAASYITAVFIFMVGAAYAGVPLYRMICQTTGYGGEVKKDQDGSKIETMSPMKDHVIRVRFNADTASSMQWNFRPQQTEITLVPGETALAFYRAKNPTDHPIVGISTYNVVPFEAGKYFNKIQCFCFEEQILNPHEEVDMPVFFYIDPEFCEDPKMERVDIITLSYTFFEAKEGQNLVLPDYFKRHPQ